MKICGSLICQNGVSEVLRCIESVAPLVDEYYILDGGSTDSTWELLNKYKEVYNLTLFQYPYDQQDKQRNRLLKKIPKDCWVINLDQDEKFNTIAQFELKAFLNRIHSDLYTSKERQLPLTLYIPNINLMKDFYHYDANNIWYFTSKVFYNDRNLHFAHGYHCNICYNEEHENANVIKAPEDWAILHYAYINPDRIKNFEQDNQTNKRAYRKDEWDVANKEVKEIPVWLK